MLSPHPPLRWALLAQLLTLCELKAAFPPPVLLPNQTAFRIMHMGLPPVAITAQSVRAMIAALAHHGLAGGWDGSVMPDVPQAALQELADARLPLIVYPNDYGADQIPFDPVISLSAEQQQAFDSTLSAAGVFWSLEIGEWGSCFHCLLSDEAWWHAVYPNQTLFDQHKAQIAGPNSSGYLSPPKTKQEAHDILQAYAHDKRRRLGGRFNSMTGFSFYEQYAGAWGASVIGLEVGENIIDTQAKFAVVSCHALARIWVAFFSRCQRYRCGQARGASRQRQLPWSAQVRLGQVD